ncbi:MAG: hypothetical protein DCO97_02020 [Marivita sp. XM-24bin2]|nr:MAG: hypothetical protein DCO97_02020 [Marivita sp. XM-24bin2]
MPTGRNATIPIAHLVISRCSHVKVGALGLILASRNSIDTAALWFIARERCGQQQPLKAGRMQRRPR